MKKFFLGLLLILFNILNSNSQVLNDNAAEIYLRLQKLNVLGSVLYIAAHPDDENNTLLPYLAKERKYRTAYLSLTRGEGGQNLIGPEQGVELGLIRTQELLAARKIDGGEQYFTRAYEFGYSKSAEETLELWDKKKVLFDMVWIIRQFQPDIIIKRFPPDKRAGHGHHAASSILADSAYFMAADKNVFPEQFKYGLKPWKPKRMMWNTFNWGQNFNTTSPDQIKIQIDTFNPFLGKGYGEIGAEARTMHKSQGEGRPKRRGDIFEYFTLTAGAPYKNDLFDDIDISWDRLEGAHFISDLIYETIDQFDFRNPQNSLDDLLRIYHKVTALPNSVWKITKEKELTELIELCSGLSFDAFTLNQNYVNGDSIQIFIALNKHFNSSVKLLKLQVGEWEKNIIKDINSEKVQEFPIKLALKDMPLTQPYFLLDSIVHNTYQNNEVFKTGWAENNPPFWAEAWFKIDSVEIYINKPVYYKYVDPVRGELYEPIVIQNPLDLKPNKPYIISRNINKEKKIEYQLTKNIPNDYSFITKLNQSNPQNFKLLSTPTLNLTQNQTTKDIVFNLKSLTNKLAYSNIILEANNSQLNTELNNNFIVNILYNHIPNIHYFKPSETKIFNLPLQLDTNLKIGFIEGAGDDIVEGLIELGYKVDLLNQDDINLINLKKYKAIILGIRASNIYEFISQKNEILNNYIFDGGVVISQYIKGNTINNKPISLGPIPFKINSQLRITNENAPMVILQPQLPLFNHPNKIELSDFDGWFQERSTYQMETKNPNFIQPIQMNDPNEQPSTGSLTIMPYGKGKFYYVSLALFRQIPIANIGAFKLLINMIESKN